MLFTRTKHQAKKARPPGSPPAASPPWSLHGNLSQNARERSLDAFSTGEVSVMVATDIAARGIHVDDVDLVVHVDPPAEHKAYLHRSGRTARAGHGGDVVTIVLPEQRADFRSLARAAKIHATPVTVAPTDPQVRALVGEVAPAVAPDRAPVAASRKAAPRPQAAAGRRRGTPSGAGAARGAGRTGGDGARTAAGGTRGAGRGTGQHRGEAGAGAPAGRSRRRRGGAGAPRATDGSRSGGSRSSGGSRPVYTSATGAPAFAGTMQDFGEQRGRRRATASGRAS